jgi:hypothetical protein
MRLFEEAEARRAALHMTCQQAHEVRLAPPLGIPATAL